MFVMRKLKKNMNLTNNKSMIEREVKWEIQKGLEDSKTKTQMCKASNRAADAKIIKANNLAWTQYQRKRDRAPVDFSNELSVDCCLFCRRYRQK
jgi:hypothetical protein